MKVTIEKSAFAKALGHVQRIVEKRNTIPILSNVLIQAEGSHVLLRATDLDIEAIEKAPADVAQDGSTTVSAHMLYEIVRKLPDGAQISIEQKPGDSALLVKSGRSRFNLQTLPDSDFPSLSVGNFDVSFEISVVELRRLLDKTQFAMSSEETRYYLNGIYFHISPGDRGDSRLAAVSTDGHRLAKCTVPMPEGIAGMPGVIVPRKAVVELQKLLDDMSATVAVEVSQTKFRATIGDVVLTTKLIDGTFPDYSRVIPVNNGKILRCDLDALRRAVDRVSTVASDKGRSLKFEAREDKVLLLVNSPDAGVAEEEVEAGYEFEPISLGFNSKYLLDILNQVDGDNVVFKLDQSNTPAIVQGVDMYDVLFVLMPVRV